MARINYEFKHVLHRIADIPLRHAADYLLTCYRYIELNPVRAGMVTAPTDYRWSSRVRNAYGAHEPRITPHPLYLGLGANDAERQQTYRKLFKAKLRLNDMDDLRAHTQQQKAWGSDHFRQQIEALA